MIQGQATLAMEAAAGNDAAFAKLLKTFNGLILRASKGLSATDIPDAFQEAAISLWTTIIPAWESEGFQTAIGPFALTVFKSKIRDLWRHDLALKRGGDRKFERLDGNDFAVASLDPALIAEQTETAARSLSRMIEMASPIGKAAIPLILDGLSYEEIERKLGCGKGSVKAAICQLRKKLSIEPRIVAIEQVDIDGTVVGTYPSAREACRRTGVPAENISAAVRGAIRKAGGFAWRRKRDRTIDDVAVAEGDAIKYAFRSATTPQRRIKAINFNR